MDHWTGDLLVETPDVQLAKQYLLEPSSHTGIYVLVNAAKPRKRELVKETSKTKRKASKTKRKAFRKSVVGKFVDFSQLIQCVEIKCIEVNDGLAGDKAVFLVARDISEKPSETI